uniref:SHSP domain-containing protein n=1 Tax=Kalanchoe fedtschenkoi TaxID=63787 RepID=A0A7N0RII2_KALFE
MGSTQPTAAATEYKDFEPQVDWIDPETANFIVRGFRRDQMRVQVSSGKLRVRGERPLEGNTVSRFTKELPIPADCDVNKITAKFEPGDILQIRLPKRSENGRQDEKPAPEAGRSKPRETLRVAGRLGEELEKRKTAVMFVLVVVGAVVVGYLSGRLNQAV